MGELWISACGRWFARSVDGKMPPAYDVIEIATGSVWLWGRYTPKGFNDRDRRYTHAEFSRMVGVWTNLGHEMPRARRWVRAFSLSFCDCDRSIPIKAFSGNIVRASCTAEFRRMVPSSHTRKHAFAEACVIRALGGATQAAV